jgi:hypothetical protein
MIVIFFTILVRVNATDCNNLAYYYSNLPEFMNSIIIEIHNSIANIESYCLHQEFPLLQSKDRIMILTLESQIPEKVTNNLLSVKELHQRPIIYDLSHVPQLDLINTSKHNQTSIHLRPWLSKAIIMDNFSTYTNYDYGFTLQYPSNWSFEEINRFVSDYDLLVVKFFPDATAKNLVNVSILIDESVINQDLNGYVTERMDKYKKSSAFDSISRSKEISYLALHPAYKLSFLESGPENRRLNSTEVGTVVGGMGFIIRSEAIDNQDLRYQKDIELIVNKFKLLGHPL